MGIRTAEVGRPGLTAPFIGGARLGDCVHGMRDPLGRCVRRFEQADGLTTAWWVARDGGFEQAWTLDAAPDGGGRLIITVALDDAVADGRGAALRVTTTGGAVLSVTSSSEVDPLWTTADWTLVGRAGSDPFAETVGGAGDVNGDDDVAIGCPSVESDTGAVYYGSASGLPETAGAQLSGTDWAANFGTSVGGAGDINGDGYDDLIVGEPGYNTETGRAFVFYGSASGVSAPYSIVLNGTGSNTYFGHSVAGARDVNADGHGDVIVGAYYVGSGSCCSPGWRRLRRRHLRGTQRSARGHRCCVRLPGFGFGHPERSLKFFLGRRLRDPLRILGRGGGRCQCRRLRRYRHR